MSNNNFIKNQNKVVKKSGPNRFAIFIIFIVIVCSVLSCFFSGYLAIKSFREPKAVKTASADELISSYSTYNYYTLMSSFTAQGDNTISYWETNYYPTLSSQGYIEQRQMTSAQPNVGISFNFSNFRTVGQSNYLDISFNFVDSDLSNFVNGFQVRNSSNEVVTDNKITVFGSVTGSAQLVSIPNVYTNSYSTISSIHKSGTSSINLTNYFLYCQPSSGTNRYIVPMYFNFYNVGPSFDYRCYKVSARIIPFYKQETLFEFWLNYRFYFLTNTTNESYVDMLFFQCSNNTYLPFYYNVINYTYYSQYYADATYQTGYSSGFEDGNRIGYTSGLEEGYNSGLSEGITRGDNQGYYRGFNEGVASANDYSFLSLMGAVVDAPIKAFTGLLNFNLLGFNMLNFFTGLLTLALILFIVSKILGGK